MAEDRYLAILLKTTRKGVDVRFRESIEKEREGAGSVQVIQRSQLVGVQLPAALEAINKMIVAHVDRKPTDLGLGPLFDEVKGKGR